MHSHALLVALACVQGCFIGGALYSGWWSWGFGGCWLGFSMGRYLWLWQIADISLELVLICCLNCAVMVEIVKINNFCRKVYMGWRCRMAQR